MDTAQWPQEMGLVMQAPMEGVLLPSATTACSARPQLVERRPRPQKEHALNCPRCQSTNTKFCYYNNYSLSQPRYFCKTCRRYWTEGGSLRNVPVGGGSRKNKRSSSSPMGGAAPSSSSSSATSAKKLPDLAPPAVSSSNLNPKFHEGQDLNLGFPQGHLTGELGEFHSMERAHGSAANPNPSTCSSAAASGNALSAMEFLRGGIPARGLSPFMPMVMAAPEAGAVYPAGFGLQDFRSSTLSFPVDGIGGGGGYGDVQGVQDGGGRVFFPFEDLRQVSPADTDMEHARAPQGGDPSVFWNGVMGGGGGGSW